MKMFYLFQAFTWYAYYWFNDVIDDVTDRDLTNVMIVDWLLLGVVNELGLLWLVIIAQ